MRNKTIHEKYSFIVRAKKIVENTNDTVSNESNIAGYLKKKLNAKNGAYLKIRDFKAIIKRQLLRHVTSSTTQLQEI